MLCYGWLGSTARQLRHYERLAAAPGRGVTGYTLPASAFFLPRRRVAAYGQLLADQALLAAADARRIAIFAMSGNGEAAVCLLLQELRERAGDRDASRLLQSISGVVYDSAPTPYTPGVMMAGFTGMLAARLRIDPAAALRSPVFRQVMQGAFGGVMKLGARDQQFADLFAGLHVDAPHLFLYSDADAVIPAEAVVQFAKEQERFSRVQLENFKTSPHVLHWRHDPARYEKVLRTFLAETLCDGPVE